MKYTVIFLLTLVIGVMKANDLNKLLYAKDKVVVFRSFNTAKVEDFGATLERKIVRRLKTVDHIPGCPTPEAPVCFKPRKGSNG